MELSALPESSVLSAGTREKLLDYREQALSWLSSQTVPNDMVAEPVPQRRNLIVSYRLDPADPVYPYLRGRSYIYDDALAIIAFTMADRFKEAEDILFALSRQIRSDGSLWFGLNLHNNWPGEDSHEEATIRSGASAWAGYSAVFYLKKQIALTPGFSLTDRIPRRFLSFAEKTAEHLQSLQITEPGDPRYGLVTGGIGSHILSSNEGTVEVSYSDERLNWVSAEHNIDAYFLFSGLWELTGDPKWKTSAEMTTRGLLSMWDSGKNQIIQGIKQDGRRDTVLPLDTSSWGSMFLRAAGELEKAEQTLTEGTIRFANGPDGEYRPYAGDPLYLDSTVTVDYFGRPDITWNELDITWPEGALGMAVAHIKAGNNEEAVKIIRTAAALSENGGIRYASLEVPHQFSTYTSVASSAWMVIAIEALLDPEDNKLFWSTP